MADAILSKEEVPVRTLCIFLSDYASWLLGCGATCIRIEKNIGRMAKAFKVDYDMAVMPSHIHLECWRDDRDHSYVQIRKIHRGSISFNINTQLSRLSWEVADGKADFPEASDRFRQIIQTPAENKWTVLLLASCANASFCRLFNGDAVSILVVFLATLIGYRLKQVLVDAGLDIRIVFICSAFVSSVIGAGCSLFGWGNTPDIALGTSVLYLIPGIPYINSVSDMIDGHYLCAFNRFVDAVILTTCLSLGLSGGMLIMGLKWF